jgi:hypothetical protein
VLENTVLRRISGPKSKKVADWRKLHNDKLYNLYASPNIIMVIKSRRMRWERHVSCTGDDFDWKT